MKNLLVIFASLALSFSLFSAEEKKERTFKGTGLCAKCSLHETEECTNALQVKGKDGTIKTFLFTENMEHGKMFCKGKTENLLVTGVTKKVDGKMMIVPTSVKQKGS
jgi:hypothetical protein